MSIPTNCTPYHLSLSHILTITKSQRLLLSLSLSEETEPNRVFRHCREQPLSLMEQDWDLHAVVRGCSSLLTSSTTTTTTTTTSSSSSSSGFGNNCYLYPESASSSSSSSCAGAGFSSVFDCEQALSLNPIEELHELCKPFFTTKSQPQFQASSPLSSSFSYSSSLPKQPQTQEKQQRSKNLLLSGGSVLTTPRSKRRKNQLKRVCEVPVENLSSDIWAWRKYGQKPIKGSPYPRGYYRCSSSKGCLARKQVERNRSDPTMFIVTYTAEHNHPAPTHRNSLAGSTRQKPLAPQSATTAGGGGESETGEKALAKPALSPITPVAEEEAQPQEEKLESREGKEEDVMDDDEEEGEFGVCDMVIPDDFFESLDELGQFTGFDDAITAGDFFNDPFSALPIPSWLAAATAASGS